jgi:hypothetical protein
VAVGFEPTVEFPPHTVSRSVPRRSGPDLNVAARPYRPHADVHERARPGTNETRAETTGRRPEKVRTTVRTNPRPRRLLVLTGCALRSKSTCKSGPSRSGPISEPWKEGRARVGVAGVFDLGTLVVTVSDQVPGASEQRGCAGVRDRYLRLTVVSCGSSGARCAASEACRAHSAMWDQRAWEVIPMKCRAWGRGTCGRVAYDSGEEL